MRYLLILLLSCTPLFAQDIIPADEFMKMKSEYVLSLLDEIQSDDREQLHGLIEEHVMPYVDSVFMAKWVAGRSAWLKASDKERQEFVDTFMDLLINSYGNTLVIFKDKNLNFKIANRSSRSSKNVQVLCTVTEKDKEPIRVIYQMKRVGDTWKSFDMVMEGISLLKGLKAQFSDDIQNYGLVGVTKKIQAHQYKLREG